MKRTKPALSMQRSRSEGFTLIELLVTLAVAAILLGIGVTSFRRTIEQARFVSAANEIVAAMNYAKAEALNRSRPVTVRMAAAGWSSGWTAFIDANRDGVMTAPADVQLRAGNPVDPGLTVTATPLFVTFDSNGRRLSNRALPFISFEVFKTSAIIDAKRTVCVTRNGTISTVKGSASCV